MPAAMAPGSFLARAASAFSGSLYSSVTRMDKILAAGATPRMPSAWPLPCPCPAMIAATSVPLTPQNGPPAFRPEPLKSGPVVTAPARSGCPVSTPVPSTATVIPAPWADCQAWVTCRPFSHHSWACTVLAGTVLAGTVLARAYPAALADVGQETVTMAASPAATGIRVRRNDRCDTLGQVSPPRLAEQACGSDVPTRPL
jgi:hypothetical protein